MPSAGQQEQWDRTPSTAQSARRPCVPSARVGWVRVNAPSTLRRPLPKGPAMYALLALGSTLTVTLPLPPACCTATEPLSAGADADSGRATRGRVVAPPSRAGTRAGAARGLAAVSVPPTSRLPASRAILGADHPVCWEICCAGNVLWWMLMVASAGGGGGACECCAWSHHCCSVRPKDARSEKTNARAPKPSLARSAQAATPTPSTTAAAPPTQSTTNTPTAPLHTAAPADGRRRKSSLSSSPSLPLRLPLPASLSLAFLQQLT